MIPLRAPPDPSGGLTRPGRGISFALQGSLPWEESVAKSNVRIERDLCENEQVCESVCPAGVFEIERGVVVVANPQECTICFKCLESCPSGAIELDY